MSLSVEQYLSSMGSHLKDSSQIQKAKNMSNYVINGVDSEIFQSRIVIPEHEKALNVKKKSQFEEASGIQHLELKSKQIAAKKKAIMEELQSVQMMQSQFKMSRSTVKNNSSSLYEGKNAKIRATLTQQEIQKIKEIKKKQRDFERKLNKKIKQFEQNQRLHKLETIKQEQNRHKEMCMQKHKQREDYIQEIKQRKKVREQSLDLQRQKIKQLKNQKKLFQRMQQNFSKLEESTEMNQTKKLDEYKKKREFSFDEMKQHQRLYDENKMAHDEQRQERVRKYRNPNELKYSCLFLDNIKEEQQLAKYQQQEKKEMIRTLAEKKAAYAEHVRKILSKNKKDMHSSKMSRSQQSIIQPKWMNTSQKYHKGTEYMRQVNSTISKMPRKALQTSTQQNQPRYKNYLVDLKNQGKDRKAMTTDNINNMAAYTNLVGAKQNISSVNLVKSVKAKIKMMNKLQNS